MRGHQRADELSTCLIVVALTDVFRGILSYSLINIDVEPSVTNGHVPYLSSEGRRLFTY